MSRNLCLFFLLVLLQLVWAKKLSTPSYSPVDTIFGGTFQSALFNQISNRNENKNVICSPFSIQAALTLLYMGAEGNTAEELRTGLQYFSPNKLENAEIISQTLNSKSDGLVQLKIANRIYTGYELAPKFNEIALKYFKSEAERVNFTDSGSTVNKINSWVEGKTNKKISNLLSPGSVDETTSAILVNAIYFKAQWADQFSKYMTRMQPFWTSASRSVDVDTMSGDITSRYGEFPQFDATAIEIPFEDNDMALLVVLPNQRDGLKALEEKLASVDLLILSANMNKDEVQVKLPKFSVEFDIGLVPVLQEMGMKTAFSSGANYSGIFKSSVPVKVSDVVHKAFIDVNEYGSEAAAATYVKVVPLSGYYNPNPKFFTADHPFVFAIKNKDTVYFVGHIVTL